MDISLFISVCNQIPDVKMSVMLLRCFHNGTQQNPSIYKCHNFTKPSRKHEIKTGFNYKTPWYSAIISKQKPL